MCMVIKAIWIALLMSAGGILAGVQTNPGPQSPPNERNPSIDTSHPAGPPYEQGINAESAAGPPQQGTGSSMNNTSGSGTMDSYGSASSKKRSANTSDSACSSYLPNTDEPRSRSVKSHSIRGQVLEINERRSVLTMRSKGTVRPYCITARTNLEPLATKLSDLKPGDHLLISFFFSHRRRVATRITVLR